MNSYKILLPLLWLAFFLRVWQLPHLPPGLWYDEAYYAMDAAWLLDGGPWRIFFEGNNGREPLFIYLQTLLIWSLGARPFTARLVAALVGTLTIPAIYILARRLARGTTWPAWLPYLAAAGLSISFWHLGLSRSGYRVILLPLIAALLCYAFWRGWRERSVTWLALAGALLGLSQYTYLAARVLPLVFAAFALVWTGFNWGDKAQLKTLWLGLIGLGLISALIFAPLGWTFYQNPALFSARTDDVVFTSDTPVELLTHISEAIRFFIDAGHLNWRHHLPGRPMLGWLGWLGFWPGLIICLRRFRQPAHLFLVVTLLTLYLPNLFATPPVHALRPAALLSIYYIIFALGLTGLAQWLTRFNPNRLFSYFPHRARSNDFSRSQAGLTTKVVATLLILVMMLEAGLTIFDYFGRWANAEETYIETNGPLVDFVEYVMAQTQASAVMIPLQLYVHPTTRFLLHAQFREEPAPPTLSGPVRLVTLPDNFRMLNVANIPDLPAFVWLTRRPDGAGLAYVSRPPRAAEQLYLKEMALQPTPEIYRDRFGRTLAEMRTIETPAPLLPMFTGPAPLRPVQINWADLALLTGYEVTPEIVRPGQPLTLNLYWRSLTEGTFNERLFLQLIDSAGHPINQWEGDAFREDMYRWRPQAILPTQHTLWLGPETPPGPYLVRLGFFDDRTGARLPLHLSPAARPADSNDATALDQVQLGLFYVSADGRDPRQPARSLSAVFADAIQLRGVTLPEPLTSKPSSPHLPVTFQWQALRPTAKPYTVFLQLLDEQGQVVSGWDRQPLNGLYPTNLWSPGEIVVDTFLLPLPETGLSPGPYRLITGFYDVETGQRLTTGAADFVELSQFVIE